MVRVTIDEFPEQTLPGFLQRATPDLCNLFDDLASRHPSSRHGHPLAGSTYSAAFFDTKTGFMKTVNVGDSATVVIRRESVIFETERTTYRFNTPFLITLQSNGGLH
jgi:hypothetical protein